MLQAWLGRGRRPPQCCARQDGQCCNAKLSARMVQSIHGVLRNALESAVREELIPRNVAKLVRVPARRFAQTIDPAAAPSDLGACGEDGEDQSSLTPKRSLVQTQYRPPARKLPLTCENTGSGAVLISASCDVRAIWIGAVRRALSRDRTRCPRCPASRCTTRCRHRQAVVARVPRRARPAVRIRPQAWPGALHPRARCRPARQDAADS